MLGPCGKVLGLHLGIRLCMLGLPVIWAGGVLHGIRILWGDSPVGLDAPLSWKKKKTLKKFYVLSPTSHWETQVTHLT